MVGITTISLLFANLLYHETDNNMGMIAVMLFLFVCFPYGCIIIYWMLTGNLAENNKFINNVEYKDVRAIP